MKRIFLLFILGHTLSIFLFADVADTIQNGFQYAISKQNLDGSWGLVPEQVQLVTGSILTAYMRHEIQNDSSLAGMIWMYRPDAKTVILK